MKRSLVMRALLAFGVLLFVAGPATAATASAATAAKKHHVKKKTTPPPPAGPSVAVTGDLTETAGDGGVGFDFHGQGWFANEAIQLNAPGLSTACDGTAEFDGVDLAAPPFSTPPAEAITDFSGIFNVAFDALFCAPGSYEVTAQEVLSPSRVATTEVTITAPTTLPTTVTLSPASEVESGTLGEIAGTVIIDGLNPAEAYTISSPALNLACAQPDANFLQLQEASGNEPGDVVHYLDGTLVPGLTGTTDFAGNDIGVFGIDGCNAGSYPIDVTEDQAGFRSFDPEFTVQAP
jgi:hypothetical protein